MLVNGRVEAREHRHLEECIGRNEPDDFVMHERGEGLQNLLLVESTCGGEVVLVIALHPDS